MTTSVQDRATQHAPLPPPRRVPTRRIAWRDRTWLRFSTVRAAGPLDLAPVHRVRLALADLHRRDPWHPMLCRVDATRGRLVAVPGRDLDDFLAAVVTGTEPGTPTELANRLLSARPAGAAPADDLPFRLLLGGTSAAIRTAHVLGDGSVTNAWFLDLLSIGPAGLPTLRTDRLPLLRGVGRQFLRRPDRVLRAVRASWPLGPPRARSTRPVEPGVSALVSARVTSGQLARLRDWRDTHQPDSSVAVVTMAASLRALAEHGLGSDGVFMMMDCRRYLAFGTGVVGNFATGPYLSPLDVTDPAQLGQSLSTAAAEAVPLLLLGALTARNLVRGGRVATRPTRAAVLPVPRVTLSHQGRLDLDRLPWTAAGRAGQADYLTAPEPSGPAGITMTFAVSSFGLHVSGSLHPGVLDPDRFAGALADLADDPVALLER